MQVALRVASSLNEVMVETHRRRHLAYLMADQGALVGNPDSAPNLPKQHLTRLGLIVRNLLAAIMRLAVGCACMPSHRRY